MSHKAIIKSAHNGTTLEFMDCESSDHFKARISGAHFDGTVTVYYSEPENLAAYFRDLAINWRGWQGKKAWSSLEDDLEFSASSDSTGHITLSTQLRDGPYPFGWSLSTTLLLEAGTLEQIASDVEKFVKHNLIA